jgi:hypothetical protein
VVQDEASAIFKPITEKLRAQGVVTEVHINSKDPPETILDIEHPTRRVLSSDVARLVYKAINRVSDGTFSTKSYVMMMGNINTHVLGFPPQGNAGKATAIWLLNRILECKKLATRLFYDPGSCFIIVFVSSSPRQWPWLQEYPIIPLR